MKMKSNYPRARLRKGIAVGSALLVSAGVTGESAGSYSPELVLSDLQGLAEPLSTLQFVPEKFAATATISIPIRPETRGWRKSDAKKLRELAIKRATRTATVEESEQFAVLQNQRRANEQVSAEEVIAEWRRRRFVGEILEVLDRNVRFFKVEDKARLRSIRNTPRA